jgi:hypothetical protein
VAKSRLEVELNQQGTAAGTDDIGDCAVNHIVLD